MVAAGISARDFKVQQIEVWLRQVQLKLGARLQGTKRLEELGEHVLQVLAEHLEARVGVIHASDDHGGFKRFGAFALPAGAGAETLRAGEGLAGQAIKEQRVLHVSELPTDYLPIASSLGRGKPRQLLVMPAAVNGTVHAVLELGLLRARRAGRPRAARAHVRSHRDRGALGERSRPAAGAARRRRSARAKSSRLSRRSCASRTKSWRDRANRW